MSVGLYNTQTARLYVTVNTSRVHHKAHLLNAGWGNVKRSFLESRETKDNNLWTKCRGSLNVNAHGTYSNNYALEVHIIIGNCV